MSGGRMHFMFNRVGGLKEDLPAGLVGPRRGRGRTAVGAGWPALRTWCSPTSVRGAHPRRRGADPRRRDAHGVSGPVARASGRRPRPAPRRALPGLLRALAEACCGADPRPTATPGRGSRCCIEQAAVSLDLVARASTGCGPCDPARSTSGCPRSCGRPRGRRTLDREPARLNGYYLVSRGERDAVADEAAQRVVQQRRRAARAAAGCPRRRPRAGAELAVLRGRRHRQVSDVGCSDDARLTKFAMEPACPHAEERRRPARRRRRRRGSGSTSPSS